MAFFSHALSPSETVLVRKPAKPGMFARFYAAMIAARQRQADAEIARWLGGRGGKLTDGTEREIEQRVLAHPRTHL
jgi:hypothetical protein